jgi:hypothetical protein
MQLLLHPTWRSVRYPFLCHIQVTDTTTDGIAVEGRAWYSYVIYSWKIFNSSVRFLNAPVNITIEVV